MARPDPKPQFCFIICSADENLRRRMRRQIADLGPIMESESWEVCREQLSRDTAYILILDADPWDETADWLARVAALQSIEHRLMIIMLSPNRDAENAIAAVGHGCFEYLIKPYNPQHLQVVIQDALRIIRHSPILPPAAAPPRVAAKSSSADTIATRNKGPRLIGHSPAMLRIYKQIGQAASSDVEVLITGESGTGKELVARALHDNSARRAHPFVAINCAAIPDNLLESELFGHERGAFTGAERMRIGKFEQATGGTVLLDEIGDMSPALQAKLLRLVQDKSYYRVGGNELRHADVRLLAATHQPLEERIAERQFRADLYYRLRVVHINLIPLRERDDDIILLAHHFAAVFGRDLNHHITAFHPETNKLLLEHRWPGNVRELQNVIKQAIVVSHGTVLRPEFLPELVALPTVPGVSSTPAAAASPTGENPSPSVPASVTPRTPSAGQTLEAISELVLTEHASAAYEVARTLLDQTLIRSALERHHGNVSAAARQLGITRITLRRKLEQKVPRNPEESPPE